MAKKHIVLLHNNDLHGDFMPQDRDGTQTGGLPRLAGYINHARHTEGNVIYAIAGDMFQGSIIDREYMGLSTIDLINLLDPDVTTLGNHEVDYGVAHLLFLEKCAEFPIINSNLYITLNHKRMFLPYINIEKEGMRIMFIGILTEEVLAKTKSEKVIGTFIGVGEAAREIAVICDNYRTKDTDLTVILTHIGIDKDRELAEMLDPRLGVDIIIGGHSHTEMEMPEVVNNIVIAQAGSGSSVIGRFDITYDTGSGSISEYSWKCVPVNENTAEPDAVVSDMLQRYHSEIDEKYQRIVTRFARKLTHPARNRETELGNLYADLLAEGSSFDVMLFASGSIRKQEMGPIVTYQDIIENTPFDDAVYMLKVSGEQLRRMLSFIFREEAWESHTEFYQFSKGLRAVWNRRDNVLEELKLDEKEVENEDMISIGLQEYHFKNFEEFFGVPVEEVAANAAPRVVAVSVFNIIEEYMTVNHGLNAYVENRIVIRD